MKALSEFRAFILQGNVVDLAIGIVIGAAFGAVVNALVKDIFTPLIAAIFGKPDFSAIAFTINHSRFLIGDFINSIVAFLSIAAVIFFVIVKPLNVIATRRKKQEDSAPTTRACPYCFNQVPIQATRCGFCTSELAPTGLAKSMGV